MPINDSAYLPRIRFTLEDLADHLQDQLLAHLSACDHLVLGSNTYQRSLILLSELGLLLENISILEIKLVHSFLYVLLTEGNVGLLVCCLNL